MVAAGGGEEKSSAAAGGAVDAAGDGVGGNTGGRGASGLSGATDTAAMSSPPPSSSLADRVRDIVEEATGVRLGAIGGDGAVSSRMPFERRALYVRLDAVGKGAACIVRFRL